MVVLNNLESTAMICALEDAVSQLNILSILDGDKGRSGATLRPLTDESDLGQSDRIRRQRGRIKIMFERLIGRLLLSADIVSLFEMGLAGSSGENKDGADAEDMDGDSKDWQDATNARRQLAEKQAEIEQVKQTIVDLQLSIPDLQDRIRFGECESMVAGHISRRWVESRLQMQQRLHCRREDATRRLTQDVRTQIRREHRVHSEIVRFLQLVTQDLKEQTESWQEKYKTNTTHWNKKLKTLQAEKDEHSARLKIVFEKLGRRMEFCAGVLEARERRRKAAEMLQRSNAAATRIQSWWRGHMVRRGFGALRRRLKQKQQKQRVSKA